MHIQIRPKEVCDTGEEMAACLRYLQNNMNSIETFVLGLDGDWKGPAQMAYASRIVYMRSEFRNLEDFLKELAELLERISDEFQEHEDELTNRLNRI